jgi:hypothetical protein
MTRIGILQNFISDKPIAANCFFNCRQDMVKTIKRKPGGENLIFNNFIRNIADAGSLSLLNSLTTMPFEILLPFL